MSGCTVVSAEQPKSNLLVKRQRLENSQANPAVDARDLDAKMITIQPPLQSKTRPSYRYSILKRADMDNKDLRVQVQYPGKIPFEIDNKKDSASISFCVTLLHEEEIAKLYAFQTDIIKKACEMKSKLWPNQSLTDAQVKQNFNPWIRIDDKKEDTDDLWPPKIKLHIPMDKNNMKMIKCDIRDHEQKNLPYNQLKKNDKVEKLMFELSNLYYLQLGAWGIKCKLFNMEMGQNDEIETPETIPWNPRTY